MPLPADLNEVMDAVEPLADEWQALINRKTGKVVAFSDEFASVAEDPDGEDVPDWMEAILPEIREALSSDDYLALPGSWEFHEYSVMERFCLSVPDEAQQDELLSAIRGRGAFRRFRDTTDRLGRTEDWYRYRDQALKQMVTDFLDDNGIPYVDKQAG